MLERRSPKRHALLYVFSKCKVSWCSRRVVRRVINEFGDEASCADYMNSLDAWNFWHAFADDVATQIFFRRAVCGGYWSIKILLKFIWTVLSI